MILSLDVTLTLQGRAPLVITADLKAPVTGLFGPSGAGKTTLLGAIAGFPSRIQGCIRFAGTTLLATTGGRVTTWVPPERRGIAIVSQPTHLFPHLSVREQLQLVQGQRPGAPSIPLERLLRDFELEDQQDQRPPQLSGGECQRLALARALASGPRLLLLDEAFSALDMSRRARLIERTSVLLQAHEIPCLIVSHDSRILCALASETLILRGDGSAALGATRQLLSAGPDDAFNVFTCQVRPSSDGSMFELTGAGCTLFSSATTLQQRDQARVSINAADVVVMKEKPAGVSARNVLQAVIDETLELPGSRLRLHVTVEGAVPFLVDVSQSAQGEIGLSPGAACWLLIKANRVEHVA